MHAAAPTFPRTRARISPRISVEAIIRATVLALMLVGAAYVAADIHSYTQQGDQAALAGGR